MAPNRTRFGSLAHYEKGGVEVIKDDARNYVFSNVFEVASKAKPYEKVAVSKKVGLQGAVSALAEAQAEKRNARQIDDN